MAEMTVIDDFISLGRAAPDKLKDKRKSYCVGGYSLDKGFIRLYPTSYKSPFKRWSPLKIPVEKNPQDTREESWKIQDSRHDFNRLDEKIEVLEKSFLKKKQRRSFVNSLVSDCIVDINEKKHSLGIIKPKSIEGFFQEREKVREEHQLGLWEFIDGLEPPEDDFIQTKKEYAYMPRIKYSCSNCKTQQEYHEQQLLEIGAYIWMLKHPDNLDQLWENYRFDDPDYDHYLFVGNQARHRTSFMVISVLWFKKDNFPLNNWKKPQKVLDWLK